jgi:hypothetical protein
MSSGWPPAEDDRRRERQRHASVVGAGHDSRDSARGYSGYARHELDEDRSSELTHTHDVEHGYDEGSWYPAPPAPRDGAHNSGSYPASDYGEAGYGEAGGEQAGDHPGYGPAGGAHGYAADG